MGFSRIQSQFLFLIGMFLFLTFLLNWMQTYQVADDKKVLGYNIPISKAARNLTFTTNVRKTANIWRPSWNDDRIVAQLRLAPKLEKGLPAKKIFLEHGVEGWGVKHGKETFTEHACPVQNCELIGPPPPGGHVDARMFKEIDISVYLIHELKKEAVRHPDQVWIMFGLESPEASPAYVGMENVLNWTATYRHDSTLVTPYDKWVPYDNFTSIDKFVPKKNYLAGRTKSAAIFVSNCNAMNDRLQYINELKQYMDVDVYGYCGDHECRHDQQDSCFNMLRKDYKFYLAFENANCRDYITEKFFMNALRNGVLPVVMGAHPDDYKRVAPPGSFIHVEEFSGPEELAKHLKMLGNNAEEYNNYFRWKEAGTFIDTKFWCRICSMLWDPDRPTLSVPDLEKWWRSEGVCIGKNRWDSFKKDDSNGVIIE
ncbi:Alpha-(1 3)-fucosyltransferase 7 [Mactra antiquata]